MERCLSLLRANVNSSTFLDKVSWLVKKYFIQDTRSSIIDKISRTQGAIHKITNNRSKILIKDQKDKKQRINDKT